MKKCFIAILFLQFSLSSIAQASFELIFGEPEINENCTQTLEHQGYYYSLGSKGVSPENYRAMVLYKISYDGQIIGQVQFPKPDTSYGINFGIPKANGNILCFGTLGHEPYPSQRRYTYVCEISPELELVWERMDSIVESHPLARHRLKTIMLTPDNEVILQGIVDTVEYGFNEFLFFAKYDLEGNRLGYTSFINYVDRNIGSLMLNEDGSGFFLFGELSVGRSSRNWIEFDFDFNYLGSGRLETHHGPPLIWSPATASWVSSDNFILANSYEIPGTNEKGLEMRLFDSGKQLLKSTAIYHDKDIRIPEYKGMGFIDENFIWVATFEPLLPDFTGEEKIKFFVFDNEINLKGSMTYEGGIRYWLWDLLATSDTACLITGVVGENPGVNMFTDNYLKKIRLDDVVTGIINQDWKVGSTIEIWPVPAGETLHVKSSIDSELLVLNGIGQHISVHSIRKGYNLISLTNLSSGIFFIAVKQNENIIETHKLIKQ
ncbi:MAG: T9SS type A sorting domain-containing protein [Bacteroidales bacterium]|nr:T9SS type A sorting domain-containing protein [Bacteroidales bacterium]